MRLAMIPTEADLFRHRPRIFRQSVFTLIQRRVKDLSFLRMDVRWHSWGREEAARLVSELDDAVSRNCAVRRQAVADIVDQLVRQKMKVKVVRSASAARSLGAVLTVLLRGVGDESGLCTRLGAAIVVCDPGVANPQSAVLATLCRQQSQDNNKYTFRLGHAVKLLLPDTLDNQMSRGDSD